MCDRCAKQMTCADGATVANRQPSDAAQYRCAKQVSWADTEACVVVQPSPTANRRTPHSTDRGRPRWAGAGRARHGYIVAHSLWAKLAGCMRARCAFIPSFPVSTCDWLCKVLCKRPAPYTPRVPRNTCSLPFHHATPPTMSDHAKPLNLAHLLAALPTPRPAPPGESWRSALPG